MATYNGEKYIYRQVKSIMDQLVENDELIVSDDGSSDATLSIIAAFGDDRIKVFKNAGQKGPVGNFENAITKATGGIIFLADQDDQWLPRKLEQHLKLHQNNGYNLVVSDAHVVDEDGNILFESFFKQRGSRPGFVKNVVKNSFIGCCMSFDRKIIVYALPFPPYIHMHDWWLGLVAELKGKTCFCDQKLIEYVRHQSNASPTLGESGYTAMKRAMNRGRLLYGILKMMLRKK
jgi:glycosyltransferase involved in cell wall biosynthesis